MAKRKPRELDEPMVPMLLHQMRYVYDNPEPTDIEKAGDPSVQIGVTALRKLFHNAPSKFFTELGAQERAYQGQLAAWHKGKAAQPAVRAADPQPAAAPAVQPLDAGSAKAVEVLDRLLADWQAERLPGSKPLG